MPSECGTSSITNAVGVGYIEVLVAGGVAQAGTAGTDARCAWIIGLLGALACHTSANLARFSVEYVRSGGATNTAVGLRMVDTASMTGQPTLASTFAAWRAALPAHTPANYAAPISGTPLQLCAGAYTLRAAAAGGDVSPICPTGTLAAISAQCSSQHADGGYGCHQLLGAPTFPPGTCADRPGAWAPSSGGEYAQWVRATFWPVPIWLTQVKVHESFGGGFVTSVEVEDEIGARRMIWPHAQIAAKTDTTACGGVFTVDFDTSSPTDLQ